MRNYRLERLQNGETLKRVPSAETKADSSTTVEVASSVHHHNGNALVGSRLMSLRKKVFVFDSSEADELFFRKAIFHYLLGKRQDTLTETMWLEVWERNEQGKYGKYTYFNEHIQKVYLDRYFFEWCKITCQFMNEELAKRGGL